MSRNILNERRIVKGGDAINITDVNSLLPTINVDISKQSAVGGAFADTDLFLLETSAGLIKKITGSNMKTGSFSSNWDRSGGFIKPVNTSDKLQLFSSINNDSSSNATFLDILSFKNTTTSSALATFKYQINDNSVNTTSNAKFKMVHYDSNTDTTTDIYSIDINSILTFSKRLTLTNGLKQGSYDYTMPSATGTLALQSELDDVWSRSSTNITQTNVGDTITLNYQADATYKDTLLIKNTNAGTDVLTYKFQIKDNGSYEAYLNFKVDYSKGGGTSIDIFDISYDGFLQVKKRLDIANGFYANSGEEYNFQATGGTLANTTFFSGTSPITYNSTTGAIGFNNSTNYITLSSLSATSPITYNSTTGAIGTTFTPTSTTNMSNKTFTDPTIFNQGVYTGYDLSRTTSGFVRFFEGLDYGFGTIDLHIEGHQIGGNYNVFLPNSVNNTILVGKNTSDILTNKTLSSSTNIITTFTGNSSATITTPNTTGTLALFSQIPTNNSVLTNGAGYITSASLPTAIWTRTTFIGGADISPIVSTDGLIVPSVKLTTILGTANPTQTKIVENTTYGWEIDGAYSEYCLKLGSTVYLGDDAGSFQIHINGVGDAYKVGADLQHIFYGNGLTCANNSFKVNYLSLKTYITDPSGTDNSVDIYGSYINYHNNGTELVLNTPNSSYQETNSQGITFSMAGYRRQIMWGSTNPAVSYYDTDGTTIYANVGRSNTFPANVGQWSSISNPMGEIVYYIAGANTNDSEGYFFAANGEGHYISNTGDDNALTWYDEDFAPSAVGWYISTGGSISSISDKRFKTDIKTYKNSNFEKYKQIRTITYKKKKPILPQKRLEKQKCIDKYNNIQYGVVAQELYSIYPELETTEQLLKFKKWKYKSDNWNNGVYEKECAEWKKKKEEYEKCNKKKDCDKSCIFNDKEPTKEFSIEEPHKVVDYQRLNILTIGVVQDLIKQNEELKNELAEMKTIINKLVSSNSFKEFKST